MSEEQAARIRIAPPLYSNISEFAAILDLSPWKVRDLIRKRRIPALVIGGRIVIETNRALESLRQQFEQKAV